MELYFVCIYYTILLACTFLLFYKKEIKNYFHIRKANRVRARMKKHAPIYDAAIGYFQDGNLEMGELRLHEYAKKIGIPMAVMRYDVLRDGFLRYRETDIFHPDGYGDGNP